MTATRNDIARPAANTVCGIIWNMLDAAQGPVTSKHVRDIAEKTGLNETTVRIQYYRYRRFHGIFGRVQLKAA